MEQDTNSKFAKKNFKALCKYLDGKKWKYETDEEKLKVNLAFKDGDYTIYVRLQFNVGLGIVVAISSFEIEISENRRSLVATAVLLANNKIEDGNFDYNCLQNRILFRIATNFIDNVLSDSLYEYLISVTYHMTKSYMRKFLKVCTTEFKTLNDLKNLING